MNKGQPAEILVAPVSTVIPCHGHADTLERAVLSIATQTVRPLEVIIVNDGSGKKVNKKVGDLQKQYGQTWISSITLPRNGGAGGARNSGWAVARGKYVSFLDADDAWHPRKIEIQYGFMEEHPDVAVCGHRHRLEKANPSWIDYRSSGRYFDLTFFRLIFSNQFITSSAMVRTNLNVRFANDQRYMEDFRIWLTVAARRKRLVMLEDELACIFKPIFGSSGLSADIIRMEIGEIKTYLAIGAEFPLLLPSMLFFIPYSLGKFFRRCILVAKKSDGSNHNKRP